MVRASYFLLPLPLLGFCVTGCCHLDGLRAPPTSSPPERIISALEADRQELLAVPGLTLGIVLNQLFDRASQLLDQAQNAGLVLEVQAASQAINIIQFAKQAYADSLELTMNAISSQQQQAISGVKGILDDVSNHALKSADELADRFQSIANTIPFSDHSPQLTSYSAAYAYATSPEVIPFRVRGNFFDVAKQDFDTYIDVGGTLIKNTTKTTTTLEFAIPRKAILSVGNRVQYHYGTLRVPYKKSCFLVGSCCGVSSFNVPFVSLPPSPGSVDIIFTKKVVQHQTAGDLTQSFVWDSSQDDKDLVQCGSPPAGWAVDPNSVAYHLTREEGKKDKDWFDLGNSSTLAAPCWHFKTLHKGFGTSGKITAYLTYNRYRDANVDQTRTQHVDLKWGMSQVVTYDALESWTMVYHRFDGTDVGFNESSSRDPYFKLSSAGASLKLETVP